MVKIKEAWVDRLDLFANNDINLILNRKCSLLIFNRILLESIQATGSAKRRSLFIQIMAQIMAHLL